MASTTDAERQQRDELVVERPYEHMLRERLERWGARPNRKDHDANLGLALVEFDAAAAVAGLSDAHEDWVADARRDAAKEAYSAAELDVTVRCLRRWFRERYHGWVPTFGKNRLMTRVAGSYVIDGGGGDGAPTPLYGYVIDGDVPASGVSGAGIGSPDAADPLRVIPLRGAGATEKRHTGRGARVGIVDTPLRPHPWLAGAYLSEAATLTLVGSGPNQPWTANHAMFVAGLVLRQAPSAVVVGVGALDNDAQQDSWNVAKAIAGLASQHVDVVNLSLGCLTDDARPPLVLTAALAALGSQTLVVAAAGNHGGAEDTAVPRPSWPAAMDNVVAVGAVHDDEIASFSPSAPWVDAFAPGVEVVSTAPGESLFARWSGTSFAAAALSGAIAARIGDGVDAHGAWRTIRRKSPTVDGRPSVRLKSPPNWPKDGRKDDRP